MIIITYMQEDVRIDDRYQEYWHKPSEFNMTIFQKPEDAANFIANMAFKYSDQNINHILVEDFKDLKEIADCKYFDAKSSLDVLCTDYYCNDYSDYDYYLNIGKERLKLASNISDLAKVKYAELKNDNQMKALALGRLQKAKEDEEQYIKDIAEFERLKTKLGKQ